MTKFRMEISALPDNREDALQLFEALKKHNADLSLSAVEIDGEELWRVNFSTQLQEEWTIEQLQEFLDTMKGAHAALGAPKN